MQRTLGALHTLGGVVFHIFIKTKSRKVPAVSAPARTFNARKLEISYFIELIYQSWRNMYKVYQASLYACYAESRVRNSENPLLKYI